jgi:hypothetical protein
MKKITLLLLVVITISACNNDTDDLIKVCKLDQSLKSTTVLSYDEFEESKNSNILNDLFRSECWQFTPQEIKSLIRYKDGIILANYYVSPIQTIAFNLKTDIIYRSLVFYYFKGQFIPVIVSSETEGQMKHLKISDYNNDLYFDFLVNKNNKMGSFQVYKSLPLFKQTPLEKLKKRLKSSDETCMDQTNNFGDCMLCAIEECSHDWICAVTCAIYAPSCMAAFGICCLID